MIPETAIPLIDSVGVALTAVLIIEGFITEAKTRKAARTQGLQESETKKAQVAEDQRRNQIEESKLAQERSEIESTMAELEYQYRVAVAYDNDITASKRLHEMAAKQERMHQIDLLLTTP